MKNQTYLKTFYKSVLIGFINTLLIFNTWSQSMYSGGYGASYGYGGMGRMGGMGGMGAMGMGSMGMMGGMGGMGAMGMGSMGMMGGMGAMGMGSMGMMGGMGMMGMGSMGMMGTMGAGTPMASGMMMGSPAAMAMMNPYMGGVGGSLGNFGAANSYAINSGTMLGIGSFMTVANQAVNMSYQMNQARIFAEFQANNKGKPPFKKKDNFFPQCLTSPAEQSRYTNACQKGSIMDPITQLKTMQIIQTANNMSRSYREALMGGKDFNTKFGIQCIQRESQKLYDRLHNEQEKLNAILSQINEKATESKTALQKKLNQIAALNSELDGSGEGGQTRESTRKDIAKFFNNNSCQYAIDTATVNPADGLYAIRDAVKKNETISESLLREINSGNIEKLIEDDIKQVARLMRTDVEQSGKANFNLITRIYINERREIDTAYNTLKKQVKDVTDVNLPETLIDFERSRQKNDLPTEAFFRDSAIRQCLNDSGRTFPINQIISGVQQIDDGKIVTEQSESLNSFRSRLSQILEQGYENIDNLIGQVKALQAEYRKKGLSFRVMVPNTISGGTNKFVNPSGVLDMNNTYCTNVYENEPISLGSNKTRQDVVREEVTALNEFKTKMDNIENTLETKVKNQMVDCNGIAAPLTVNDCNDTLVRSSDSFCVKHARTCAKGTVDCISGATQEIKKRENKIKKIAAEYNSTVVDVVKTQNKELKRLAVQVQESAQKLQKLIPGGRLTLGKTKGASGNLADTLNLFIQEPLEGNQNYKVNLKGDGKLDFFDKVGEKIVLLKDAIKSQEIDLKKMVDARIKELKKQYTAEQKYWDELLKNCNEANQMYAQMKQRQMMMQDMQKNMRRMQMMNFCSQLQFAQVGPGCQQRAQMLTQQLAMIAPYLGPGPEMLKVQEYARICNRMAISQNANQSMQDSIVNVGQNPQGINLADLCHKDAGGSSETLFQAYANVVKDNGWQFATTFNTNYKGYVKDLQHEEIYSVINDRSKQTLQNGEVVSIYGIPQKDLLKYSSGTYMLRLASLKRALYSKSFNGKGLCEYVEELGGPNSSIYQECHSRNLAGTSFSASGEAVSLQMQGPEICINQKVDRQIRSRGNDDVNKILGDIRQLSMLKNRIEPEMQMWSSESMGKSPNINCAGMAAFPRSSGGGMIPGGMTGMSGGGMMPGSLRY